MCFLINSAFVFIRFPNINNPLWNDFRMIIYRFSLDEKGDLLTKLLLSYSMKNHRKNKLEEREGNRICNDVFM